MLNTPYQAGMQLADFLQRHAKVMILTGAGVSTDSGIPDYRDHNGQWKRKQPVLHQDFMGSEAVRKRYWGRSLAGWPMIQAARPNRAHCCLAQLEQRGHISLLVTQNVDRLHQSAGSQRVLDLHGRADEVLCMQCGHRLSRASLHDQQHRLNPSWRHLVADMAPDGDADLECDFTSFQLVDCPLCDGILKPDVAFFGDNVAKEHVALAMEALAESDALLVVGSSLMVYSGYRFCRQAHEWGKPIASLNLGKTRADALLSTQLQSSIFDTLQTALDLLS